MTAVAQLIRVMNEFVIIALSVIDASGPSCLTYIHVILGDPDFKSKRLFLSPRPPNRFYHFTFKWKLIVGNFLPVSCLQIRAPFLAKWKKVGFQSSFFGGVELAQIRGARKLVHLAVTSSADFKNELIRHPQKKCETLKVRPFSRFARMQELCLGGKKLPTISFH